MIRKAQITFLLMTFSIISYSQGVEELDKRNGFQDIKMATNIKNYPGLEFKKVVKNDIFPNTQLYVARKGYYEKIGNIDIHDLEVLVYRDSIFQIRVVTDKDPLLYKGLKKAFGEPEFSLATGKSQWDATNVRLYYDDHSKKKMEMVYFSHRMVDKLKEDKKDALEDFSEEF